MEKIKSITIADNEEYLRQISLPVDLKKDPIDEYINILEQYCNEHLVHAMAAVQLGIPKRIIYIRNTDFNKVEKWINNEVSDEEEQKVNEKRVLINPVITKKEGLTEYWEACASCLDNFGRVLRPYKMNVEYYDVFGNIHEEEFVGFESTVLCHEMDHLDGILHMDISEENIVMPAKNRKEFRKNHSYEIFEQQGDYETLKREKRGFIKEQ